GGGSARGNSDFDVSILKIDLSVPPSANCVAFDFRFLSEEYPGYVGSLFNDAFVAELDSSTWTTSGSTISAPDNFAFDSSHNVVSINSTGIGGMSAANGAGTPFNGSTNYAANRMSPPNGNSPAAGAPGSPHAPRPITPHPHSPPPSPSAPGNRFLHSPPGFVPLHPRGRPPPPARPNCSRGRAAGRPADHGHRPGGERHRGQHLQRAGGGVHRSGRQCDRERVRSHDRLGRRHPDDCRH